MSILKKLFIIWVCTIGFSSHAFAETELIIVTGEIPPVISEQSDKSFLTAVFQAVEKEMGVKFVFRFLPWKRCEQSVEELKAWGAIPYVRTPEREKKFDFSERLFNSSSKLFGYSPDGKIKDISYTELSDLKKYRIGGVRGYWYEKKFRDAGIELELVTTEEQNFKKLGSGRVDLVPIDETSGWYIIKNLFPKEESGKFFTLTKPFHTKDCFLMTSKQYPNGQELLKKFNTALKKIKDNGDFQKIADKFGVLITY
jgi:polar amino acid transport system substrate-binding protein